MFKVFSQRFASKISSKTEEIDLTCPAVSVTDLQSQIVRIEAEFKLSVPRIVSLSFIPNLYTLTSNSLIVSDFTGNILEYIFALNSMEKYEVDGNIYSLSYNNLRESVFISSENLYELNLETKKIQKVADVNVGFFKAFDENAFSCAENLIKSWDLKSMQSKTLYEHNSAFMIDVHQDYIVSLSSSQLIAFNSSIAFNYDSFSGDAYYLKITQNYIAMAGAFSYIILIRFSDWQVRVVLEENYSVSYFCVDINEADGILIAAGSKTVSAYDLKVERETLVIVEGLNNYITCGYLDNGKVFACSKDSQILIWDQVKFSDRVIIKTPEKPDWLCEFENFIIVYNENEVFYVDSSTYAINTLKIGENREIVHCVLSEATRLLVAKGDSIYIYSSGFELVAVKLIRKIFNKLLSTSQNYFFIFNDKIEILSKDFEYQIEIRSARDPISVAITTSQGLYIGFNSGKIKLFSPSTADELAIMSEHKQNIKSLAYISKKTLLVSSSDDETIKIWRCGKYLCIFTYNVHRCCKIIVSESCSYYLSLRSDCKIDIHDSNDFALHTTLSADFLSTDMCLIQNDRLIAVLSPYGILLLNNPLSFNQISAFGARVNSTAYFKKQIYGLIHGKSLKNLEEFAEWVITPYQITAICLLSYLNKTSQLQSAVKQNSLHPTSSGDTSISICLQKNYIDSLELILKCLYNIVEINPYSLYYLENIFLELNKKSVPSLSKLYSLAMNKSFIKSLPKFCINPSSLPIVIESESMIPDPEQFMPTENYSALGKAINFTHTFIRINTNLGSYESIKFMDSLLQCENKEIFKTPLIKTILDEKWKKVKLIMLVQAVVYAAYVIALALFCTKYYNGGFLILPFIISKVLMVYEIFQLVSDFKNYVNDQWNYVDACRAGLFMGYSIWYWNGSSPSKELLSIIVFLTWCRGITYFRLFSETRYYINLLFQVVRDMVAFFIIFFYSIVGFALVFFTLSDLSDYYPFLTDTYMLNLGSSNTDGYNKLQWLYFLLVTILNPIIMLNLLISIMSDTYGRVQADLLIADSLGLCCMIKEIESLLFWRRNLNDKCYIHICDIDKPKEVISGEAKYLRDIKMQVKEIGKYSQDNHWNLSRQIDSLTTSMQQTEKTIKDFKQGLR